MVDLKDIELRSADLSDFDEIARIWHRSASLPGVGPHTMPTINDLRRRIDEEVASNWSITLATSASDILGFLAIKPATRILDQLFITPEAIGTGIGRLLFAHAQQLMSDGFSLHTAESNVHARSFYEKSGMVFIRKSDHPRSGHPIVWYEWMPRQ